MKKSAFFSLIFPHKVKRAGNLFCFSKICLFVFFILVSSNVFTQVLPPATSCTSKDLVLVGASLPPNQGENVCTCKGTRTLMLTIDNKTGSTRTSFALWGTLEVKDPNGDPVPGKGGSIFACAGPILSSSVNTLPSNYTIIVECGETYVLKDLFLAWTTSNKKETCDLLKANPGLIAPKCGTVAEVMVELGVDANFSVKDAICTTSGVQGSITVSPYGGVGPYTVAIGSDSRSVAIGGSTVFNLPAGTYSTTITESRNCAVTKSRVISSPAAVIAEAGTGFIKTCKDNTLGKQIGEPDNANYTFSWSPTTGLSAANVSNPTANPSTTTSYTVTKTNKATGCFNTDNVTVTVNTTAPSANAGADFTKTCISNPGGKPIGEPSDADYTFSWSPTTGLSAANMSNPNANPSTTTFYTVTKTNIATGCTATDVVTVTVNTTAPIANAGEDFTKTCKDNPEGKQIGEPNDADYTFSWSPATGLSTADVSNPTANPSSTTTYTVTKTNKVTGCYKTDDVLVTVNKDSPPVPTICVKEPSLCGPSTGSITILSPTGIAGTYAYSINNGSNYTDDKTFWDGLAAGSVTGIKVKMLGNGCESGAANCSDSDCSSPAAVNSGSKNEFALTGIKEKEAVSEFSVKAFPNPFRNEVKFIVTIPEAGNGSLELFNMAGQKVKTIYQGLMNPGINSYEITMPLQQSATLLYMLRLGEKKLTGKLLQISQ
jgi:hypothetical protein